jgi:molybdate transport repressor ModE-like protein
MLDVRRLIMLRAVAAEGSIAAAARRLQYTRSAVSQQLSALEAEAGAALVERAGNRITLTPAGRGLVEHAERIVVELRAAEASLEGATGITGVDVVRHSLHIVRDGEHLSPRMAAAISAVRAVGLGRPADQPADGR